MTASGLTMVCCPDISGQLRGKAYPTSDHASRRIRGVGWVPTNMQITAFDSIAPSPFGALGDLLLVPAADTDFTLEVGESGSRVTYCLGNLLNLDGTPWAPCLRNVLSEAIGRLEEEAGLRAIVAFEHEFHMAIPGYRHRSFALESMQKLGQFPDELFSMLRACGLQPDSFIPEYGANQFEVTVAPKPALRAADEASILRAAVRALAGARGFEASFSPLVKPDGVGNGLHIHFSLIDLDGNPVTYDPEASSGLSGVAGSFVGGVLKHLPSIVSLLAPSVISYARLVPHRWSCAYNNLGLRDREAAARICPVPMIDGVDPGRSFNIEIRAADAAAAPHLQLAAILLAGLSGLNEQMPTPPVTNTDLSSLPETELRSLAVERLPQSLGEALDRLEQSPTVRSWLPPDLVSLYLDHKRAEVASLERVDIEERCSAYARAY